MKAQRRVSSRHSVFVVLLAVSLLTLMACAQDDVATEGSEEISGVSQNFSPESEVEYLVSTATFDAQPSSDFDARELYRNVASYELNSPERLQDFQSDVLEDIFKERLTPHETPRMGTYELVDCVVIGEDGGLRRADNWFGGTTLFSEVSYSLDLAAISNEQGFDELDVHQDINDGVMHFRGARSSEILFARSNGELVYRMEHKSYTYNNDEGDPHMSWMILSRVDDARAPIMPGQPVFMRMRYVHGF